MANEIRATSNLQVSVDGLTVTNNSTQTLSMSGSVYLAGVQTIGTSYEALAIGDLANIRVFSATNVSTASIELSMHSTSASFAVLQPDDTMLLTPSGSFKTYYLKATQPNADVQIVATEA